MTSRTDGEREAYEQGYGAGIRQSDRSDVRAKEWTIRVIVVALVIGVVAIGVTIAVSVNEAAKRDQALRAACSEAGGIWDGRACVFSAPR